MDFIKKKNMLIISALSLTVIGSTLLVGCGKTDKGTIDYDYDYHINYELNGGSNNSDNPNTYRKGDTISFKNPTKRGYEFVGWFSDDKFSELITSIDKNNQGSITLYAKFTPINYTISYDFDGGEEVKSNPRKYSVETPTFTLNMPRKHGFDFVGWIDLDNPNDKSIRFPKFVKGSQGNKRYKAEWKRTKYIINTVSEHGITTLPGGSEVNQTISFNITPDNGYEIQSITFNGKPFDINLKEFIMPDENVDFVIKYKTIPYTIDYDLDGGTVNQQTLIKSYTVESDSIHLPIPTKKGYEFYGWKKEETDTAIKNVTINKGSYGNLHYKAYWIAKHYNVKSTVSEHGQVNIHSKDGYTPKYGEEITFDIICDKGWVVSKVIINNVEYLKTTRSYIIDGDVDIKVYYEREYKITYNLDSGNFINGDEVVYSYEESSEDIYLPMPQKEGFTFVGWTTLNNTNPIKNFVIKKGSTGDINLIANWEAISSNDNA